MNKKFIALTIVISLISIAFTSLTFAQESPPVEGGPGGGLVASIEYKNVTLGETFTVSTSATSPYKWELIEYNKEYLDSKGAGVGCGIIPDKNETICTYSFSFTAIKEGKTTIELNKISTTDNSTYEIRYIHVTIVSTYGKPDLTIGKIEYFLDNPTNPTKLHFQVLIRNIGTASCSFDSNIRIPQLSNYQENKCTYLNPGESCVESGYGYSGLGGTIPTGYYDIIAVVDPRNLVDELNEDNNQAERRVYVNPTIPIIEEYKTVKVGEIFTVSGTFSGGTPYAWRLKSYDTTYLEYLGEETICATIPGGICSTNFKFKAKIAGKTKVELNKIDTRNNNIVEIKYIYVTILSSPIKIVRLNEPFELSEGEIAEVVDYRNMIVGLDKIETITVCPITTAGETPTPQQECKVTWLATLSIRMPGDLEVLIIKLGIGDIRDTPFGVKIRFDRLVSSNTGVFTVYQEAREFKFSIKTDKYWYSHGESVRIEAILVGDPSINFADARVIAHVIDPRGPAYRHEVEMRRVGVIAPTCTEAVTTGSYTCPRVNEYHFVGIFDIPFDAPIGLYTVKSTALVEGITKEAETSFRVGETYPEGVDVSIMPERQVTSIGKEVSYRVTITDKQPPQPCPTGVEECPMRIYTYIIDVSGLPYHTLYPRVVGVPTGGSETFELLVFPSSVRTAQGITTAVEKVEITETVAEERTVAPTGGAVATQPTMVEEVPVREAVFRFTVKATLREDPTVSDSAIGILHVRFIEIPEPPPFPEETIKIELRRGWNLISLPGKGSGFTQGTCSAIQKPLAYVYLQDQNRYVTLEEAVRIMGSEKLLDYLSTHSFWIYSYEDCNVGFKVTSYSTYSGLPIVQGWNLLGTTKDMIGETLNNIKGTCTFERVYTWDAASQKWAEKTENDLIEKIGYGILVKATSACNLQTNVIQPPAFPGG